MCCEGQQRMVLPRVVSAMLDRYRESAAEFGWGWGEQLPQRFRAARLARLADAVPSSPTPLPSGVALARADGLEVGLPLPYATGTAAVRYVVLEATGGTVAALDEVAVTADQPDLHVAGRSVRAVDPVEAGQVRLVADAPSRWSLVDDRGGAWFPPGALRKYDS